MASPKKTAAKKVAAKKTTAKKIAAKKTTAKKTVASKVTAKKTAVTKKAAAKTTDKNPLIKKGSKFDCKVCGFAITVDNISGSVEEAYLICCETPMNLKNPAVRKK